MSYFASIYLKDSSGNTIHSNVDVNGSYHLGVGMIQDVIADANNSSVDNILFGETWSGTPSNTLGVVGLQFSLKTDQNCTIYIDQSPDGTKWDVIDSYNYIASLGGNGWTTQAVNSHVRVRVKNDGLSATTYFRCQMALCPTVEAVPRSLSEDGRLKTECHISDNLNRHVSITPNGQLLTNETTRLVGTSFNNSNYDENFWLTGGTDGGFVLIDGEAQLFTSTNPIGYSKVESVAKARFVPGYANKFTGLARLVTTQTTGNTRQFGTYDDNDGFYFVMSGITFGVGSRKNGVDTIINSGSFNGDLGSQIVMNTNIQKLSIEITPNKISYFVGDSLLHLLTQPQELLSNTLELPIRIENFNNGSTINHELYLRMALIVRHGPLNTESAYKFIGTNATTICKYGAGRLHKIVNVDNAGSVTIYDNIVAGGTQIAVIDTAKALGTLDFDCPFSNGLTIVTASGAKITVIYE